MTEEAGVIAMRVVDQPDELIPGSSRRPCDSCGEVCWLAPSSLLVLNGPVACIPCAIREGILEANPLVATREQLDEYFRYVHGRPPGRNTLLVEIVDEPRSES